MITDTIERTLWYETKDEPVELPQCELLYRSEPLVILGEAGMGKSHLLNWLATFSGNASCTARQLINRHDPRTLLGDAQTLVIDALDEVTGQKEGDAVDLVLRKLGELDYPHFILSCRVADWRSATGLEAIREQYPDKSVEMHLVPFNDEDAKAFLSISLGAEVAESVIDHFNERGLNGLLTNPQTLEFISIIEPGNLPNTRNELFERAIETLRKEHKDTKLDGQPSKELGLDAAGAAFACLILSGNEAITRRAATNQEEGELQLNDVSDLPSGEFLEGMLGTRLFRADGADRFSYLHRRVGEYLGARWLAKQADNAHKRRRLLSLFHSHGLVPASLRGIHAWLARDPALAQTVIEADPMGVIEYGDADDLTIDQGHSLIHALIRLAAANPRFRDWGDYSLRGIAQLAHIETLQRLITESETPFYLKIMVLEAIETTDLAKELLTDLKTIALDTREVYACRRAASDALIGLLDQDEDWTTILRALHRHGDEDSVRLAIELTSKVGYEAISDELIVELVITWAKIDCNSIGVLWNIERSLPENRIDGVLDRFVAVVRTLSDPYERPADFNLTDFLYRLVLRAITTDWLTAEKLWFWLEPFRASVGYDQEVREKLNILIRKNDSLRRSVQRHVFLETADDDSIFQRELRLDDRLTGLMPTPGDIIELLNCLDSDDQNNERWRDLIQLTRHTEEEGAEVREAARPFAAHRPDLLKWIDNLPLKAHKWQKKEVKRKRKRQAKQATTQLANREYHATNIEQMRNGVFGAIIDPAIAYLNMFTDIRSDTPAYKRISRWLGEDISDAAFEGFETFLVSDPSEPSAQEIVESYVQGKYYQSQYILVSALAERFRKGIGFADLIDDRLMAGLFVLRRSNLSADAGVDGLKQEIERAVEHRGLWEQAMRLYHEPQLEAGLDHVHGLCQLMSDEAHSELGADLSVEWLERYPNISTIPEAELIDKLLESRRFDGLRSALADRNRVGIRNDERRRTWDAVGLIVNFQQTATQLETTGIEPELLWYIRARTGGRSNTRIIITLTPAQIEWFIRSFRETWPMTERPDRVTGNRNSSDASQYIVHLIHHLGNDSSEDAVAALVRLRDSQVDGYTEAIKSVIAEQVRIRVEANYTPPTCAAINAIARDLPPVSSTDLQSLIVEELEIVQRKINSDDAESWRGFYDDDDVPFEEERCRDHLLGLLRQGTNEITYIPEAHVAGDKEVDLTCSVGKLRIPIEIKGQWHPELWKGADNQLDRLYTPDWQAERRGIYLVLWFGDQKKENKQLRSPGRGVERPLAADELRDMLIAESKSAREGRIIIFVLNLERSKLKSN